MPEDLVAKVAAIPELGSTTESEQMYLITVARAVEAGAEGPVGISRIAKDLSVSIPSANEMIRKLDARGLLTYEPYHGVQLTTAGVHIADQVLRTRRLWATFLADHLGFSPLDADEQACHLEHATTAEAADRLAAFLGNPEAGPLGGPIPDLSVVVDHRPSVRLSEVPIGVTVEVVSVVAPARTLEFLASEGVKVGNLLSVAAGGTSGLLIRCDGGDVHLGAGIVDTISVRPVRDAYVTP
jgi:DtxR family Mn-dependent transcriptional regulator